MNEDIQATYTERAGLMNAAAQKEIFKQIRAEWQRAQKERTKVQRIVVDYVNRYARIGSLLVQVSGHEQMGFSFWRSHLAEQLPFDFETTQRCIAIHKKIPEPVKTVEEAAKVLQATFITAGLLTLPDAGEPGRPAAKSPLAWFITEMNSTRVQLEKWFKEEPLESAPDDRLDTIIAQTLPIVSVHERAARLRMERANRS